MIYDELIDSDDAHLGSGAHNMFEFLKQDEQDICRTIMKERNIEYFSGYVKFFNWDEVSLDGDFDHAELQCIAEMTLALYLYYTAKREQIPH